MYTQQEAFDKALDHLRKQGKPAVIEAEEKSKYGPKFACAYRSPDGCMCAIGVLIPDDEYMPGFENNGIALVAEKWGLPESLKELDIEFLSALQRIHDEAYFEISDHDGLDFLDLAEKKAKLLADKYSLSYKAA